MSRDELKDAYHVAWSEASAQSVTTNVAQIVKFSQSMDIGDLVLICGRYDGVNKGNDAFIYGVARVVGMKGQSFFDDKKSRWWRFKRRVAIQRIEQYIPRKMIANALDRGALTHTIHSLDSDAFGRLTDVLHSELGMAINV